MEEDKKISTPPLKLQKFWRGNLTWFFRKTGNQETGTRRALLSGVQSLLTSKLQRVRTAHCSRTLRMGSRTYYHRPLHLYSNKSRPDRCIWHRGEILGTPGRTLTHCAA